MTAIPAAVVIWLCRRLQLHAAWFFGSTGAVIGGLSLSLFVSFFLSTPGSRPPSGAAVIGPLFSVAGLVAGLTYWRVAERFADKRRSDAQVAP
jgi:protein-S-isoprenylcysteine O-methyltransferase Ste14